MVMMKNYRDQSTTGNDLSAGFQFEFYCERCDHTWRSPFKPYRFGQLTAWLTRLAFLTSNLTNAGRTTGAVADSGSRGAKEAALAEAMVQAQRHYRRCDTCRKFVCEECWNDREDSCTACIKQEAQQLRDFGSRAVAEAGAQGLACPSCSAPNQGGRFCPECGFDMANTHKACPACGNTVPRQARFCGGCGHGF